MDALGARHPALEAALHRALRRSRIPPDDVEARLLYTGVSQSLHVSCPSLRFRRVIQLPPEDLRPDTAWGELCETLADDLARLRGRAGSAPRP